MKQIIFAIALALVGQLVSAEQPRLQRFKVHHTQDTDLPNTSNRLTGLTVDLYIENASHVDVWGHVNLEASRLRQRSCGLVFGCGATRTCEHERSPRNTAGTLPVFIKGAVTGSNIRDVTDHYAQGNFEAYEFLDQPGWYRIEIWGNSHTSLSPHSGMIEVLTERDPFNRPLNQMLVRVERAD